MEIPTLHDKEDSVFNNWQIQIQRLHIRLFY